MNADNLTQMLQKGLRVTLGAASSLVEVLQNPQRREENLEKIQSQLTQLAEEWTEKGAVTEQEARNFVDSLLARAQSGPENSGSSVPRSASVTTTVTVSDPEPVENIQDLTEQLAALREELERLRRSESNQ
ncbi:MAG: hypothetical protein HC835_13380 [Oscillatoriales cyanobacterium RM2_1_1]|nr:hypothetical protein [Oscillatoriales cyanobacterium SM2_3_0]NJO46537.1 hypothetical protein [Oscillatoriales cyanobacterium RM2_1_1]